MTHYSTRDLLQKSVSSPKQKGLTETERRQAFLSNVESCDDYFNVYINVEDKVVKKARFEGNGCAISVASTDVFLNLIEDKQIEEVSNIIDIYSRFLNGDLETTGYEILDHFKLVQEHRSRIKCASVILEKLREEIKKYE